MAMKALEMDRRVTRVESISFWLLSKNCISPEHSQIIQICLYFDLAKSYLDKCTNGARVHAHYKYVEQMVKPVPLPDGSTADARQDWHKRA